jgi:O-acetyl-ADP-ribose deacetylase (regulator of RNase III)
LLPASSVVADCTAIDYTAKGDETWPKTAGRAHIECVGIPGYPGRFYPRVAGVAAHGAGAGASKHITYVKGDATEPRGPGSRILAFVVNDRGLRWGAGFGRAVQAKWPELQKSFESWARQSRSQFRLGAAHEFRINNELTALAMICQHGYGPSVFPRIRYGALEDCLRNLGQMAHRTAASVHMPKIGAGQAGGNWMVIREMVEENLCQKGLDVTIYELPRSEPKHGTKQTLLVES